MGRGNWFPGYVADDNYELVYVEIVEAGVTLDGDMLDEEVKNFYDTVWSFLSPSFHWLYPHDCERRGYGRDDLVIARNGFFELVIDSQGDYWHQGLSLILRDDAPAFAHRLLRPTAKRLFDALAERYELSIRCCAWTSAPYKPDAVLT